MPNTDTLRGERARLLRQLLERHAFELSARKQDLRGRSMENTDVVEEFESGILREERSLGAAMASISSRTVQLLEASLRRLRTGSYGRCSDCAGPIAPARLSALQFVDTCRDCQERRDQASGVPILV